MLTRLFQTREAFYQEGNNEPGRAVTIDFAQIISVTEYGIEESKSVISVPGSTWVVLEEYPTVVAHWQNYINSVGAG